MTEEHDLSIYDLSIYMICLSTSSVYLHASARSRHPQLVRVVEVVETEGVVEEEEEEAPLPRAPAPSLHTPRRQSELNTQVRTLQHVINMYVQTNNTPCCERRPVLWMYACCCTMCACVWCCSTIRFRVQPEDAVDNVVLGLGCFCPLVSRCPLHIHFWFNPGFNLFKPRPPDNLVGIKHPVLRSFTRGTIPGKRTPGGLDKNTRDTFRD